MPFEIRDDLHPDRRRIAWLPRQVAPATSQTLTSSCSGAARDTRAIPMTSAPSVRRIWRRITGIRPHLRRQASPELEAARIHSAGGGAQDQNAELPEHSTREAAIVSYAPAEGLPIGGLRLAAAKGLALAADGGPTQDCARLGQRAGWTQVARERRTESETENVPKTRTVPFFNYPALFMRHETEIMATVRDVGSRGAFIMQKDLAAFEANLASFLGVKHAFGVADGSNAITIALIASGIEPGDEVILPSHTFIATPAAVHAAGAVPVLVDCGADHMMDVASARAAITPRTRGIIPVQLNGRTCQMDEIAELAAKHRLAVVEDAAQALGAKFKDQSAGTFGSAGTFSFYPAKLLGCLGDGGGVVTNDDAVAEQIFMLRDHGRDRDGNIRRWGFNSRLDNLQAAILDMKLTHFESEIARRREIAGLYTQRLIDLEQLLLPPAPDQPGDVRFDVFQNYEIEALDRDGLREHLSSVGIGTTVQWGGMPVHGFKELGFTEAPPYTEAMFQRCLLLPMNTTLSDDDIHYVADAIRSFYGV